MAFLRTITFFRSMSTTQLTWIAQQLEPVAWSRGAVLAEQGQRPTHLLLLRSGEARLSVTLQKLVVDVAVLVPVVPVALVVAGAEHPWALAATLPR